MRVRERKRARIRKSDQNRQIILMPIRHNITDIAPVAYTNGDKFAANRLLTFSIASEPITRAILLPHGQWVDSNWHSHRCI